VATEAGVETLAGRKVLRMSGARLERFRKNPIVLDAHARDTVLSVIGQAVIKVDGLVLTADIHFAKTARAETAWTLVQAGFLKATSIGYRPSKVRVLAEGEMDGSGDSMVTGPARIVNEWELYEISLVPVPADANALRRCLENVGSTRSLEGIDHADPAYWRTARIRALAPRWMPAEHVDNIICAAGGDVEAARVLLLQELRVRNPEHKKTPASTAPAVALTPESVTSYFCDHPAMFKFGAEPSRSGVKPTDVARGL